MEKYTFYIQPDTDNEEQMKNVAGLLEALHQNYGVIYEAVMRERPVMVYIPALPRPDEYEDLLESELDEEDADGEEHDFDPPF